MSADASPSCGSPGGHAIQSVADYTSEGRIPLVTSAGSVGKLKGIKGSGTYKGSGLADGTSDVEVEGEYTMPAAKTTKAPGDKG